MISIDIHRQRFPKNWRLSCRFVLSLWGNYLELTVYHLKLNLDDPRDFFLYIIDQLKSASIILNKYRKSSL